MIKDLKLDYKLYRIHFLNMDENENIVNKITTRKGCDGQFCSSAIVCKALY